MHSTHYRYRTIFLRLLIVTILCSVTVGRPEGASADPVPGPGSTISGVVFRDFNANGVQDLNQTIPNQGVIQDPQNAGVSPLASDEGLAGVTVTARCVTNLGGDGLPGTQDDLLTTFGPVQTAADGSYTITTSGVVAVAPPAQACRIEFTGLPDGYEPSAFGTGEGNTSGTSVQFVNPGTTNVSYGVNRPPDYCQDNPLLITNCYKFGDQVNGGNNAAPVILSFPYNAGSARKTGGAPYADFDTPTGHAIEIPAAQVGSTFGLTLRRGTQELYLAAYMKRHTGFGPGADQTINTADDPVTIYRYDLNTGAINGRFVVPGPSTNAHDVNNYLRDDGTVSWAAIGRTSLGDIALSESGDVLYVFNLENRTLYALNANTGAPLASAALPTANVPTPGDSTPTCAADDVRPFAVRFYQGKLYAGLVCSAESTQRLTDLWAHVYEVDPVTLAFSANPIFQFALNYPRNMATNKPTQPADWNPWSPVFKTLPPNFTDAGGHAPVYPQPMLVGLDFDADGNMILGLRDRFGDQVGNATQSNPANDNFYIGVGVGDTLKACFNGTGWTLEDNSRCGGQGAGPQNNGEGPGNGEFYYGDDYDNLHDEITIGGLVAVPGYPEIVVTTIEPIFFPPATTSVTADGGVRHFDNNTGAPNTAYRIYNSTFENINLFAKANGLGDLEVLCDAAPLEFGNRVWHDINHNGVQDPAEPPLAGVTVQLFKGGEQIATAVTNAKGEYYFVGNPEPDTNPGDYLGIVVGGILPNQTDYEIRIPSGQPALANFFLTIAKANSGADSDTRDSDGVQNGANAVFAIPTSGSAGQNRHTYDFGFWIAGPDISLKKYTNGEDADLPTGPEVGYGGVVTWTYDITNTGTVTLSNVTLVDDIEGTITCPKTLLLPAEGMTCVLTGIATTLGQYANTAVVTGTPTLFPTTRVTDTNPSHYLTRPFSLGNRVWLDNGAGGGVRNDGVQNGSEPGIGNVLVQLLDANGNPILGPNNQPLTTVTAADGCYLFDSLRQGTYIVQIAANNFAAGQALATYFSSQGNSVGGVAPSPDNNVDLDDNGNDTPVNGAIRSGTVTLSLNNEPLGEALCGPGSGSALDRNSNLTVDFGFVSPEQLVRLGNLVWHDANNNGLKDPTEAGIDGVGVQLFAAGQTPGVDAPLRTTTTAGGGFYLFDDLQPGDYFVYIPTPPAQYPVSSTTTDVNDDGKDNDDNGIQTGGSGGPVRSPVINLAPGAEPDTPVDTDDTNGDLTIDFGFFAPVSVGDFVWFDNNRNGLQDSGETGVPGVTVTVFRSDGTPATDVNGTPVPSQSTNANGNYLFTNLPPGSYYVVFDRATLPAGFTITTPNVGADDAVDSDASISSGQTAPTPFLLSGTQDLTLDMGVLQPQGVRVGDYVWIDANLNGQQDAGEVGVPNVTVRLFNADGDAQVGVATQTDSSGFYLFADLPPGSYYVVFDLSTLPAGFQVTTQNANGVSDALDSDASPTTGRTANTPFLNEGEEDLSLDMGVYALLSLGNLVWVDEGADGNPNDPLFNNGLYDAGVEVGLTSTVVSLYKISDTLNVTDTSTLTGTLVSTMTTDDNGNYRFNGLLPGQYFVQIVVSDGYVSSTGRPPGPNAPYEPAPDPDNNIDNDDNGTGTANPSVIRTLPVSLSIGDEPAEGGNYNPTVDFGVCRGCAREQSFATIGDFVWLDQNCDGVQDVNSAPVPNVTVRLFKATGELVGTQLTNAQGKYLFTDLEPGQYIVEFVRPAQYIFAPSKQGSNIQLDSDAVPVATGSTVARTATIELVPLETDLSWDAGLCQPTSLPPSDEPSLNGSIFLPFVRR